MHALARLPQRICVVGTSGSGKTTLARQLSAQLGIPHVEFDALHWGPNWTPVEKSVFRQRVDQALSGERWVTCGNYFSNIRDLSHARADTLIWLDYPFPLVFARVVRRTAMRLIRNETLWQDNRESLRKVLSRDSIILWVFQSHWKHRRRYPSLSSDPAYAHLSIVRLRSPMETQRFLKSVSLIVE